MAKARPKSVKVEEFGDEEAAAAEGSPAELVQKDFEESTLPEALRAAEEEECLEKSPPPAEEKPYTVGSWRGLTQYQCKLCPWDTLEGEEAMLEHLRTAHAPPPEPKSPILIAKR
jgi:hypothetical protein